MAPNLARAHAHTLAFLALMPAGLVGNGIEPAGRGAQDTPGQSNQLGYGICYLISTSSDGSIAEGQDDTEFTWQVTCVGGNGDAAQALAVSDLVVVACVGHQLTVTGRATTHIEQEPGSGGVRRDEAETQPALWLATPRFTVTSTPA